MNSWPPARTGGRRGEGKLTDHPLSTLGAPHPHTSAHRSKHCPLSNQDPFLGTEVSSEPKQIDHQGCCHKDKSYQLSLTRLCSVGGCLWFRAIASVSGGEVSSDCNPGFPSLGTVDVSGSIILLWGCPLHCKVFSSVPGLHPLHARSTSIIVFRHGPCPLGASHENHGWNPL